jgi:hypothetical protein
VESPSHSCNQTAPAACWLPFQNKILSAWPYLYTIT